MARTHSAHAFELERRRALVVDQLDDRPGPYGLEVLVGLPGGAVDHWTVPDTMGLLFDATKIGPVSREAQFLNAHVAVWRGEERFDVPVDFDRPPRTGGARTEEDQMQTAVASPETPADVIGEVWAVLIARDDRPIALYSTVAEAGKHMRAHMIASQARNLAQGIEDLENRKAWVDWLLTESPDESPPHIYETRPAGPFRGWEGDPGLHLKMLRAIIAGNEKATARLATFRSRIADLIADRPGMQSHYAEEWGYRVVRWPVRGRAPERLSTEDVGDPDDAVDPTEIDHGGDVPEDPYEARELA